MASVPALPPQQPAPAPVAPPPPPQQQQPAPAPIAVPPLLDPTLLRLQSDFYLAEMTARAQQYKDWHTNPAVVSGKHPCATEHLWATIFSQACVLDCMSEFAKLAELVGCQPIGSVDNERRFSKVNTIKTKLRSRLEEDHINACVRIASSCFTHADVPFDVAYDLWNPQNSGARRL